MSENKREVERQKERERERERERGEGWLRQRERRTDLFRAPVSVCCQCPVNYDIHMERRSLE